MHVEGSVELGDVHLSLGFIVSERAGVMVDGAGGMS